MLDQAEPSGESWKSWKADKLRPAATGVSREEIRKIQDAVFDTQNDKWQDAIEKKGRAPFISYLRICARELLSRAVLRAKVP
ncbi:MAG: hypothetical protein WBZ42_08650 [Halobacteriota archaeon]